MAKSYLKTGGTGFTGIALVRRLLQEQYNVKSLDNDIGEDSRRLNDDVKDLEIIDFRQLIWLKTAGGSRTAKGVAPTR